MKKGHNKLGSRGYGKFIDSYRKTKPQKAKSGMKKHKRKLKKSDMGFEIQPTNKIRSKFSEAQSEDSSLKEKPMTVTQTSLMKAVKGTPGYDQWLEKIRQARAAHAKGPDKPINFSSSHSNLLDSARKGDLNMLHHPEAHNIRDAQGMSLLHYLARNGKKEVLGHPQVHATRDSLGRSPLHLLAEQNIPDIIGHPNVSNVHDNMGNTPLHVLAQQKNPAVLEHPDVSTVKNLRGRTPLHSSAFARMEEAQEHPDFKNPGVVDNSGRMPFDIWQGTSAKEPVLAGAGIQKSYHDFMKPLEKSDPTIKAYAVHGVAVNIEWPKGSKREYTKNGKVKHGPKMKADYGYVVGTYTEDGEELDVYVGDNVFSQNVYLLLQKPTPYDIKMGFKDPEEKWMLGFNSIDEAEKVYKKSMPPDWFKSIKEVSLDEFKSKVTEGSARLLRAKDVGLVTLPESVKGTSCGNCMYFKTNFCTNERVLQPVLKSQCCDLWRRLDMQLPPETTIEEYNKVSKAVGAYVPIQDTPGMFGTDKATYHGFEEIKKAQDGLKKDLESLPAITAQQGSKEQGAVYSFHDADNFSKSGGVKIGKNKKRLNLANKLKNLGKANGFVGDAGFVQRKKRKVPDTSAQSQDFQSVEKSNEQYNRATNPFLLGLNKRLNKFRKSVAVRGGFQKYDMVNKINRMKYNRERLKSTISDEDGNSDIRSINKALNRAVVKLNNIPKLVFHI